MSDAQLPGSRRADPGARGERHPTPREGPPEGPPKEQPREGLRERKKRLTRATLAANAQRLFRERGFDQVTVAEIAESANVSVKTLFVYFASKEDLVFADEFTLLEQIRERLARRPPGSSASTEVRRLTHDLIAAGAAEPTEGIGTFARLIGNHPGLHTRLLLMWERYEQALAETLAAETGTDPLEPANRAGSAMLITPFRLLTSTDVRNHIADEQLGGWIDNCFDLIDAALSTPSAPRAGLPLSERG